MHDAKVQIGNNLPVKGMLNAVQSEYLLMEEVHGTR
jgi:hypothetical protein